MKKKNSGKELLQKLGTLMALALLVLIFCVMMPDKFPRISNIMNIFKQASINCLIASGMLCALITAGIDLSVGSNCVLCTCTIAARRLSRIIVGKRPMRSADRSRTLCACVSAPVPSKMPV